MNHHLHLHLLMLLLKKLNYYLLIHFYHQLQERVFQRRMVQLPLRHLHLQ